MLALDDKKAIVAEVNEKASVAMSAVLFEYSGLSVTEMTELRVKARENGVYLKVVRNTLAKRAFKETEFECLDDQLVGPLCMALSLEDPGAAGRVIKDAAKDNEFVKVKALAVGGKLYGASDIDVLAKLPTKDQALAMLMGLMMAPVTNLAKALNDVPGRAVRVISAVADQKKQA